MASHGYTITWIQERPGRCVVCTFGDQVRYHRVIITCIGWDSDSVRSASRTMRLIVKIESCRIESGIVVSWVFVMDSIVLVIFWSSQSVLCASCLLLLSSCFHMSVMTTIRDHATLNHSRDLSHVGHLITWIALHALQSRRTKVFR